jgi:hypothetical protein
MYVKRLLMAVTMISGASSAAVAQGATQTVTFQIDAINQIAFTGSPSLVVNTAMAGSNPSGSSTVASWAVTTNQSNAKITASIGAAMPTGLTLTVALTAPTGATSAGAQSLGTTAVDVVTGITQRAQSGLSVTYTLTAVPTAGVVASTTRTVTYTITGGT